MFLNDDPNHETTTPPQVQVPQTMREQFLQSGTDPAGIRWTAEEVEAYKVRNARINADPTFNADLTNLLLIHDDLREDVVRFQAGRILFGAEGAQERVVTTAAQAVDAARAEGRPAPAHVQEKLAKLADACATSDFKARWAAYIQACQSRKARIAEAKLVLEAEIAAAKARYALAIAEPLPTPPNKA